MVEVTCVRCRSRKLYDTEEFDKHMERVKYHIRHRLPDGEYEDLDLCDNCRKKLNTMINDFILFNS